MKKKLTALVLAMVLLFSCGLLVYANYDCDYGVPIRSSSDDPSGPGGTRPPVRSRGLLVHANYDCDYGVTIRSNSEPCDPGGGRPPVR